MGHGVAHSCGSAPSEGCMLLWRIAWAGVNGRGWSGDQKGWRGRGIKQIPCCQHGKRGLAGKPGSLAPKGREKPPWKLAGQTLGHTRSDTKAKGITAAVSGMSFLILGGLVGQRLYLGTFFV